MFPVFEIAKLVIFSQTTHILDKKCGKKVDFQPMALPLAEQKGQRRLCAPPPLAYFISDLS
jgi:hypothetical protein